MTNWDLETEAGEMRLPLVGVFNKDNLPSIHREGFYIINMQDDYDSKGNDLSGTHWVVFYIEGNQAVYFDSFGFKPPLQVQNFLKNWLPYPYNEKHIQNIRSGVCGKYVLAFMKFMHSNRQIRSLKERLQKFISRFKTDTTQNRRILLSMLGGQSPPSPHT